jgi:hypothetical protein
MSSSVSNVVQATLLIRKLRGGSDPVLLAASDGLHYVVKFSNNLQGPNVLFNEAAGTELYHACGLPSPAWKPLLVTDSFLDRNRGAWMETDDGPLRPAAGLCFASLFMGGEPGRTFEILPGSYFQRIGNRMDFWLAWLVDACADHVDNRQAIFKEDARGALHALFIDHGHLFGGPDGKHRLPVIGSRYLDPRIYPAFGPEFGRNEIAGLLKPLRSIDTGRIWRRVQALPEEWKSDSAFDRLRRSLDALADANRVRALLDAMFFDVESSTDRSVAPARFGPLPHAASAYPHLGRMALETRPVAG